MKRGSQPTLYHCAVLPTFSPVVVAVPDGDGFHTEGLSDFIRWISVDPGQVDILRGVRTKLRVLSSTTCKYNNVQIFKTEKFNITSTESCI